MTDELERTTEDETYAPRLTAGCLITGSIILVLAAIITIGVIWYVY